MTQQENLQVAIGPEFFARIPNDYADANWALVREFAQNAIDCGSTRFALQTGDGKLTATNDGPSMDRDVLDKFFTLGGTTKGANETGGFGLAKLILCFCHQQYHIATGNLMVSGRGASYTVNTINETMGGTTTEITLSNRFSVSEIREAAGTFAKLANWKGTLTVDGETLATDLKGTKKANLSWCTVSTTTRVKNLLVVRVNGCPMFYRRLSYKNGILLEITGDTKTILNSNRDSLKYTYQSQLDEFIKKLEGNSATLSQCTYEVQEGNKVEVEKEPEPTKESEAAENLVEAAARGPVSAPVEEPAQQAQVAIQRQENPVEATVKAMCADQSAFVLRNETGMKVDPSFRPGTLSKHSLRLISLWTKALVSIHKALNIRDTFTVGFVVSESAEALHEVTSRFGRVYYINPVKIEKVQGTKGEFRTMRRRPIDKAQILADAIHEVVHGLGFNYHDESFASKLTDVFAVCIRHGIRL